MVLLIDNLTAKINLNKGIFSCPSAHQKQGTDSCPFLSAMFYGFDMLICLLLEYVLIILRKCETQ